ncbi:MAG: hypothetical protein KatS3mg107_1096 [Gemmataceae bacterium]|nr:MAG: hypothetical protein KatS3mg107_1096 [Gemmataceae bacterium]
MERLQYSYDRNGNRLSRVNLLNSELSESYSYDNLNQLIGFTRGEHSRSWDYDAQGNWQSVVTDGNVQTRTHNAQNEITGISGAVLPTYDANGNLTRDEVGRQFVYDAWNRLVEVRDGSGETVKRYAYDGLHRRVQETAGGVTTDFYYSEQWQVLEERVGGNTTVQYVWSPVYVDALVLRDRDSDGDGTLDERLWVVQDANYNVTAIFDNSGNVVERYIYDPFGQATVLDAEWNVWSGGNAYDWLYLHQGGRYDATSGLYHFRFRDYSPILGRWTSLDPLSYAAGDVNLVRYVGNNPTNKTDPSGLLPPDSLFPINEAERKLVDDVNNRKWEDAKQKFMAWYNAEKRDMAWLKELPTPPDRLEFKKVQKCVVAPEPGNRYGTWVEVWEPVLPDGWVPDSKFSMKTLGYHPNAEYGIRSKTPTASGAGQQAMYDKNGKLITGGLSAGTPDKISPVKSRVEHIIIDVTPFDLARDLDKHFGGDKFRRLYLEVRPPMKSKTAPDNIVD